MILPLATHFLLVWILLFALTKLQFCSAMKKTSIIPDDEQEQQVVDRKTELWLEPWFFVLTFSFNFSAFCHLIFSFVPYPCSFSSFYKTNSSCFQFHLTRPQLLTTVLFMSNGYYITLSRRLLFFAMSQYMVRSRVSALLL